MTEQECSFDYRATVSLIFQIRDMSRENKLLESLNEVTKCKVDGSTVSRGLPVT